MTQVDSQRKPIVIIGAGIGGLSTAIRLAAAGQAVTVVEQNAQVGGKMSQWVADGFRWDTGPSVITMRPVLEELFQSAGRQLTDYLTLQPVEPLTRYFYADGTYLDLTNHWPALAAQLAALEPADVAGYLRFLAHAAELHSITGPTFIYDQPPDWRSLLGVSPRKISKIAPWLTLDQSIQRFVHSPHLRQLLGRFATYVGASPYQAPATLGVIAHVELTGGVWYSQGGIYAIAQALRQLATELGVELRLGQAVQQITVSNEAATGIMLTTGDEIAAQTVIANVDVTTVYERLLPPSPKTARQRYKLQQIEPSCSGYVLLLGVEEQHPTLAHHNIFFAPDYRQEFADIFQQGRPPREPTIYVAITSKSDPTHAPPGCENWFVLVNAPPLGSQFDWQQEEARYRQQILDRLAAVGYPIQSRLRHITALTPVDLAQRTGAWRGALYGLSSNQALNAFRRPHNRCATIRGLYFVGGTTHPGGGVPMVILSSKVVTAMILEE
ncbi:MAG: phytoene desaturase [Caldilineaceae bacterium]|nr:phytoene desaturase [Caldilineaceae bacterium]